MKLKKKVPEGTCAAMRCKEPCNDIVVVYEDEQVQFCDTHLEKSGAVEVEYLPEPQAALDALENPYPLGMTDREKDEEPETLAEVVEQQQVALRREARELEEALEMVQAFEIENQEDFDFAEEARNEAKDQWNELETRRKKATQPLNQSLKEINSWFKPPKNALEAIQRAWEAKLKEARIRAEEERQALLEVAQETEDASERHEALVAASEAPMASSKTSFRDNWLFEITDPEQLPGEYWIPNEKMISNVVKAMKDQTNIPGVKVWNDPIVSKSRTR